MLEAIGCDYDNKKLWSLPYHTGRMTYVYFLAQIVQREMMKLFNESRRFVLLSTINFQNRNMRLISWSKLTDSIQHSQLLKLEQLNFSRTYVYYKYLQPPVIDWFLANGILSWHSSKNSGNLFLIMTRLDFDFILLAKISQIWLWSIMILTLFLVFIAISGRVIRLLGRRNRSYVH